MEKRDRELILEFKSRLSSDLEKHLSRLIVFGSRARGEAADDSDIDVLALVDEKSNEIERLLEDIAYQVMWDHDFKPIISLKVLTISRFNNALNQGFSFYKHIEEEGVPI